jgi:two-component system CheB/CheR fusion protein
MATNPLRIVVVDDDRDNTDSLVWLLQATGHEVIGCYAGARSIEIACGCRPDVMLLDLAMPQLDGYQVAKHLREHNNSKNTLLIAVSGFTDEAHRQLAIEAGFDHYLIKPIEVPVLQALLEARKHKLEHGSILEKHT